MKKLVLLNETEREIAGQTAMEIDGKYYEMGNIVVNLDNDSESDKRSQIKYLQIIRRVIEMSRTGEIKGVLCTLIDGVSEAKKDKGHLHLEGMEIVEPEKALELIREALQKVVKSPTIIKSSDKAIEA
ncbi:hypothetical protein KKA95_01300 [Patescibacteria group bacterium]|nr:hypothetical protein [Patescibacteria group bacterium]